ncbi:MAG: hypothetical protein JW750_00330 [Anaerolineaceae bacterium]|nr:hypothetical protein [Anaerolineaceae bacterium]
MRPLAEIESITAIHPVPYHAQIADRDAVEAHLDKGKPLNEDLYWRQTGAKNIDEYVHWATRSCGVVCAKMCVEAFGGPSLPIQAWIDRGLAIDAYLIEQSDSGETIELGWKHFALAALLEEHGLLAQPQPLEAAAFCEPLTQGELLIASVSAEIGTHRPITHRGGHLVVVHGAVCEHGKITSLILHNPSGRTRMLQENAQIPFERFCSAFSGRIISVGTLPRH